MSHNILCRDEISFTSLVSPILLNDCEMWGCFLKSVGNNYDKFVSRIFDERIAPENMHNEVCRMALGVHSKASNHAVKGELGRFPLHLIIYTRIFKHFVMLFTLPNNQILNSALETNIFNNVGEHLRFTAVRHLLHFTKLSDFFQICHILTPRQFLTRLECLKEICFKNTRNIGRKIWTRINSIPKLEIN